MRPPEQLERQYRDDHGFQRLNLGGQPAFHATVTSPSKHRCSEHSGSEGAEKGVCRHDRA